MENNDSISDILDNLMMLILYPVSNHNTHINPSNENNATLEDVPADIGDDTVFNQILNSSLNDKCSYKYILSEEGESQLKTITFTKELKEINNCCPIMS